MVFSIAGAPQGYVAVVGSGGGRDPAAVILDGDLTVVAPGQGDRTITELAGEDGASLRTSVSNAIGTWASRYAVVDLDGLGSAVERAGGVTVNLPDVYALPSGNVGPGETELSASDVIALLDERAEDADLRFQAVLEGILAVGGVTFEAPDVAESDDTGGALAILGTAQGAGVEVAPAEGVAGSVVVPSQPEFDTLFAQLFGVPAPVRAIVQNGVGTPGIGEQVAERIIPEGFRIVISDNAESFDHQQTDITAHGAEHQADAERVQRALGVGTVTVGQGSGFTDVTIVVGKDFEA